MRKHKTRNQILSIILIMLILLVIGGGALILLDITSGGNSFLSSASDSESAAQSSDSSSNFSSEAPDSSTIDVSSETSVEPDSSASDSSDESSKEEPIPLVSISIPDRSTFPEILDIVSSASGVSTDELNKQAETLAALLPDLQAALKCYFPLEGYILSGTYEIPQDTPLLEGILKESLDRLSRIVNTDDYSIHEILSMASIIEIESSRGGESEHHPEEMPHIASVIFNRLNSSMQLQMDVTFQYGYNTLQPYGADEAVLEQYNTYDTPALPVGPICSPSEDAVAAVMTPKTSDDLFFVFDEEGNYYYATDYETHLDNCQLIGIR